MAKKIKKLGEQFFGEEPTKKILASRPASGSEASELVTKQAADIWRRIGEGEIDLAYAYTHVTYDEYRPVYCEDTLTTLLLNYGYRIDSILVFIDQFIASDVKPIVIMSKHKMTIYSEVKALKGIPGK